MARERELILGESRNSLRRTHSRLPQQPTESVRSDGMASRRESSSIKRRMAQGGQPARQQHGCTMNPRINALALRSWVSPPQPIHVRLVLRQSRCNGKPGGSLQLAIREQRDGRKRERTWPLLEGATLLASGRDAEERRERRKRSSTYVECRNQPLHVRLPYSRCISRVTWQMISPMKSGMRRLEDFTCICNRVRVIKAQLHIVRSDTIHGEAFTSQHMLHPRTDFELRSKTGRQISVSSPADQPRRARHPPSCL
jgi:hypothetical protein